MTFKDIIALAKAGYTPADVREFLAAEKDSEKETVQDVTGVDAPAEKTEKVEKIVENVEKENVSRETIPVPKNEPEAAADADEYKQKYLDAAEALKRMQEESTRREQERPESAQETVNKLFAEMM